MPSVSGDVVGMTPTTLDYEIRIMADPGALLRSVTVWDTMGIPLPFEPAIEPCASNFYIGRAFGIARGRFPLSIEVSDCDDRTFGRDVLPLVGLPPGASGLGIRLPCTAVECADNPECGRFQGALSMQRNRVAMLCRQVASCRDAFIRYTVIAAAASAGFLAAMAVAGPAASGGWIGAIISVIFFAIAAAFFAIAAWATGEAIQKRQELDRLESELRQAQTDFNSVLERVFATCCPGCIYIDTTMPC
jgi:hypothetical protein